MAEWSDEAARLLVSLADGTRTAGDLVARINSACKTSYTRSAIISKCRRDGLKLTEKKINVGKPKVRRVAHLRSAKVVPIPPPIQRASSETGEDGCADPGCPSKAAEGAYCSHHSSLYYARRPVRVFR
jgi:hypothetical protein